MNKINKIFLLLDRKEKALVMLLFILSVMNMLLEIFSIGILVPLFSNLTNEINFSNDFFNKILKFTNFEIFKKTSSVIIIIISIFFIKNFFLLLLKWLENKLSYNFLRKNSKNLFEYYLNKNYLFHVKSNSADLIKNIGQECNIISFNLLRPILSILSSLVSVLTIFIFLLLIDFKITLTIVIILTFVGIVFSNFTKKILKNLGEDRHIHSGKALKNLQQAFSNIREIIISNSRNFFIENFDFHNLKNLRSGLISNFIFSIPRSIVEISVVILISLIIIFLTLNNTSFTEIVLTLSMFILGASKLMPGTSNLVSNFSTITYNINATKIFNNSYFKFLKNKKLSIDSSSKEFKFNQIKFSNVSFKYPNKKNLILNNINLSFKNDDKIGIIGETGSGKTTLINILTGLLEPIKGTIKIDKSDFNDQINKWQNIVSYVPQNFLTLDENLKQNITLGTARSNNKRVNKIIQILDLQKISKRFRKVGAIGERGAKLSGGQNQRVGIARALYRNSKVLIFDESLNSIDVNLRDKIISKIFKLYEKKLIILVSHQKDSLKKFSKIYKIKSGRLIKIK